MRPSLNRLGVAAVVTPIIALGAVSAADAKYVSGHQIPISQTKAKMTGDLVGTWKITNFKILEHNPLFYAAGTEQFTGCIDQARDGSCDGDPTGTLSFSFRYWAKMKGKNVVQLGTCSHRVTDASGGLAGTTGFIMMVDTPKRSGKGVTTQYEGDLQLPGATASRARAAQAC
jgi:hypothetical protein